MICSPVMNYFASAGLEILEKAFAQAKHASRAELAASRSRDFEPRQGVAGKALALVLWMLLCALRMRGSEGVFSSFLLCSRWFWNTTGLLRGEWAASSALEITELTCGLQPSTRPNRLSGFSDDGASLLQAEGFMVGLYLDPTEQRHSAELQAPALAATAKLR